LELRRYLSLLKKWGWLMLLIVGLAVAGSYLYSQTIPPTYRAQAILLVGQEQSSANPTYADIYVSSNLPQAFSLLATQPSVLEAAAKEIGWEGTWESLFFSVSATTTPGGQTIQIAATARTPQRAQAIANEIARQVILQSPISKQQQAEDTQRAFITEQQSLVQTQIVAGQNSLAELNQQAALETDEERLGNLNTRITALQTKIESWQRTYLQMGSLLNASSGKFLTLISPAQAPTAPISPNVLQNMLFAAAAGLVLAGGVALLLEYLDDTIKTPEDVERILKHTTLGSIARISPVRKPGDALITVRHPRSPTAEDYRSLRTNLRYSGIENPGGALLVTSANPGEGKTTTAANLAVALAQSGKRVILVDADLRRPGVHPMFGLSNDAGLSTLFLEDAPPPEKVMQNTGVPGLRVLTSGEPPPNPAELLDSKRMSDLLLELRSEADMVVVDSPPLLVVADANILASRCSGAVLVVDSGKTRTDAGRKVIASLTRSKVKLLGIVLNRMSGRHGGYYNNYYYYSSGKGKGKGNALPKGLAHENGRAAGNGTGKKEPEADRTTTGPS
jgi:non-specific protein-tyrosine kinase